MSKRKRSRARKGAGSVYRPAGRRIWYIEFTVGKRTYRESSKSDNREDAERLLRQRQVEMDAGIRIDQYKVKFFEIAILVVNDYDLKERKTKDDLVYRLDEYILPSFGNLRAVEITGAHLMNFAKNRKQKGATNGEVNRELAIVRRAYRIAKQRRVLSIDPPHVDFLPELRKRTSYWKEGELTTLMKFLPENIHPLIWFLYHTGWRVSEGMNLEWRNIDWERLEIRLDPGTTKSREPRIFPFIPGLEELIVQQYKKTVSLQKEKGIVIPWVFHRDGRKICAFNKAWAKAIREGKLHGRKVHDFRSTAARNLIKMGFDPQEVCKLVGWESTAMLDYYKVVDAEDLHRTAKRLREENKNERITNSQ